mgnify:CR=1 FL=1
MESLNGLRVKNWQIVSGCERLTPGCDSCPSYWEYLADDRDYSAMFHPERLVEPLKEKLPHRYVVALGSDMFHESVSIENLESIFEVMHQCPHHFFELTTKRIERAYTATKDFDWPKNVSMGVSVESGEYKWRIEYLKKMAPPFKVISMVPLLASMGDLNLDGISMVGIQAETWGLKRPMLPEWAGEIKEQCKNQGVNFHQEANILINGAIQCPVQ